MKKYLYLLLCLISSYTIHAQFSAGIKTGANFSNIELDDIDLDIEGIVTPRTFTMFGAYGAYTFDSGISLQLGVNYNKRGVTFQHSEYLNVFDFPVPHGVKTKLNAKYIDIPMTINYSKKFGRWGVYTKAGLGISMAIATNLEPYASIQTDYRLEKIKISNDRFNSTEIFGIAGFGFSLDVGRGKIFIEAEYQYSFETLDPDYLDDLDLKNKGTSIGIGYARRF